MEYAKGKKIKQLYKTKIKKIFLCSCCLVWYGVGVHMERNVCLEFMYQFSRWKSLFLLSRFLYEIHFNITKFEMK